MSGGVILSAASGFHRTHRPDAAMLGVLKLDAAQRELLATTAERLAPLAADPPADWEAELDRRERAWREAGDEDPDRRRALAREDVVALLAVGLVRSGLQLRGVTLRGLHWTRATSQEVADEAAARLPDVDEDRVLMNHAVKSVDGFFTTFFVSPYSRYLARWAGRRGLTPNQVTTASIVLGVLSAACFATGERGGLVAGAVLLQIAFTTDCVDGQLARYTRQFSELGAWLDATFDRAKEYLVSRGSRSAPTGGRPVWVLAGAALTLQTVRHTMDFSFPAIAAPAGRRRRQPPVEQSLDARARAAPPPRRRRASPRLPGRKRAACSRQLGRW